MDNYIDYNPAIDQLYDDYITYSSALQLTAHNSFCSIEDGFLYHPQQHFDVKHQFKYGARGFMVDVYDSHLNNHTLLLHNQDIQALSGISSSVTKTFYFEDYLEDVHYLLERYDRSVITLIIENGKLVDSNKIKNALDNTGLTKYLLNTDPNTNTVTFGHMRNTDQRLVVFLENGSKVATNNIYTTAYYKETTYSLEKDQDCIDRKENRVPFSNKKVNIFILNHFYSGSCNEKLGVTSIAKPKCSEVNDYHNIIKRFELCKAEGNIPTFLGVDFIEHGINGGALEVLKYANNVTSSAFTISTYSSIPTSDHPWKIDVGTVITYFAGVGTVLMGMLVYNKCIAGHKIKRH
jgi:hypothetical protein